MAKKFRELSERAAFATKSSWDAFLVGLAASVGALLSAAFQVVLGGVLVFLTGILIGIS